MQYYLPTRKRNFINKSVLFIAICFVLALVGCKQKKDNPQIITFHSNAARTGVYDSTLRFKKFGSLNWKYKTNGKIFSSPAVANGITYFGSEDGSLYALDVNTGTLHWKFETKGAISSSPCVYGHRIYFLSFDGQLYAVDANTGNEIWKFKTEGENKVGAFGLWNMKPSDQYMDDLYDFFLSSPVVAKVGNTTVLCFGSSDGNLYTLNIEDGSLLWKFKTNGIIHTSPAFDNNTFYIGSWDTFIYAIDAATGKEKWTFKTREQPVYHILEGIQASPTIADSTLFIGARDGYFYAINANTGALKWKYFNDNAWVLTTAAVQNNTVYFGTSDTYKLLTLDTKTGTEKFHIQANGYIYASPVIAGNSLFFGDFTGQVFAVDLSTSEKSFQTFSTEARNKNANSILNPQGLLDFGFLAKKDNPAKYSTNLRVMEAFYKLGPILSSPVIAAETLFFGSADSCLYALKLE